MKPEQIAELERLLAEASSGSWAVDREWNQLKGTAVIEVVGGPDIADARYLGGTNQAYANAQAIVAMHNAAPDLIATAKEVERLRLVVEVACGVAHKACDPHDLIDAVRIYETTNP
jgi:hypothetical protein